MVHRRNIPPSEIYIPYVFLPLSSDNSNKYQLPADAISFDEKMDYEIFSQNE